MTRCPAGFAVVPGPGHHALESKVWAHLKQRSEGTGIKVLSYYQSYDYMCIPRSCLQFEVAKDSFAEAPVLVGSKHTYCTLVSHLWLLSSPSIAALSQWAHVLTPLDGQGLGLP